MLINNAHCRCRMPAGHCLGHSQKPLLCANTLDKDELEYFQYFTRIFTRNTKYNNNISSLKLGVNAVTIVAIVVTIVYFIC